MTLCSGSCQIWVWLWSSRCFSKRRTFWSSSRQKRRSWSWCWHLCGRCKRWFWFPKRHRWRQTDGFDGCWAMMGDENMEDGRGQKFGISRFRIGCNCCYTGIDKVWWNDEPLFLTWRSDVEPLFMTWQSDDEPHVVTSSWCVFRQDELTKGFDECDKFSDEKVTNSLCPNTWKIGWNWKRSKNLENCCRGG